MSNDDPTAQKPVDTWVTGDEPVTGPQRSYLETLAREAGEDVPEGLTKAEASKMIERLQDASGRSGGHEDSRTSSTVSVDDVREQGIVDQQAAADVAPREIGPDDEPAADDGRHG